MSEAVQIQRAGKLKTAGIMAETVAALMWGPKSFGELVEMVGACKQTQITILQQLRRAGVIRVVAAHKTDPSAPGQPMKIYGLQQKPFEFEDVRYQSPLKRSD